MLDAVNRRVLESRRALDEDRESGTPGQRNVGQAAEFTKRGWRGKLFLR